MTAKCVSIFPSERVCIPESASTTVRLKISSDKAAKELLKQNNKKKTKRQDNKNWQGIVHLLSFIALSLIMFNICDGIKQSFHCVSHSMAVYPSIYYHFTCTRGLLECFPAVFEWRWAYTLDKLTVYCRITWKDNQPFRSCTHSG